MSFFYIQHGFKIYLHKVCATYVIKNYVDDLPNHVSHDAKSMLKKEKINVKQHRPHIFI